MRETIENDVNYFQTARGLLVSPVDKADYPGVLIIHEFWGLNNEIKIFARNLAAQGYVCLAVDLYQGQVTKDPERASRLARSIAQYEVMSNLRAGVEYLRLHEAANKIASIGFCLGGAKSIQLAISGESLDGVVIYYGELSGDVRNLRQIKCPVLGFFGEIDVVVPVHQVLEFEAALNVLGIENEVYVYTGVGHGFAMPSNLNYAEKEALDAWTKTLNFLKRNLKASPRKIPIKVE